MKLLVKTPDCITKFMTYLQFYFLIPAPSPPAPEPTPYEILLKEIAEAGDKLVVLNFCAPWFLGCPLMNERVKKLTKMNPNVVFIDLDFEKNIEAAIHFDIKTLPAFKFLKKSKVIDQMNGYDIDELKKLVKKYDTVL